MIDEKKLIEEIKYLLFNSEMLSPRWFAINEMLEIIKRQPEVGEWIPCSEWMSCNARLPKYGEDVEVTTKDGDRLIGHYAGGCWYDSIDWNYIRVAAWKEPSEPWEGGKE